MDYLSYSVRPSGKKISPQWSYDTGYVTLVENGSGAVVSALKEGQTSITVSYDGYSATCIITISGYSDSYLNNQDPYIYSSTSIIQMKPDESERINVSLYGGTAADIDNYTWTVDKPAVAALAPTGQYCSVKALQEGYARIKVINSKAAYPYYIGIYVFADKTKSTYITTDQNIVTLYKSQGEKTITVALTNPVNENYKSSFSWELTGDNTPCVTMTANSEKAVLTPISSGTTTLRVTHPDATGGYPLDITVRVIEIVDNVYIEPSDTIVNISGDTSKTVTAELKGLKTGTSYSNDDFTWAVDDQNIVAWYSSGNQIVLTGLKNGSTQLTIGHKMSEKKRQVLLIVQDQTADAIDSSCYITTSQNYIKTKVGADSATLNVLLKGGEEGDEKNFVWTVKQDAKDGVSDVISLTTENGTTASSRAASTTYAYGTAVIKPLAEGTATIKITNPKVYYPTEVLVKVLPKGSILEDPLYFSGDSIIKFLNTDAYNYTVQLNGDSKTGSDESGIDWKSDNSALKVLGNGTKAVLSSKGSGATISNITISHPKVQNSKKVLVLTADTQEALDSIKAFYTDKSYYSINTGKTANLFVNTAGFADDTDFSQISWTSSNPQTASVEKGSNPLTGIVTGNSAGSATVTAKYLDTASVSFQITVYPAGTNIDTVEKTVYLTTTQNVYVLGSTGISKTVSVTPVGLSEIEYGNIVWESSAENVATVVGNGTKATVNAVGTGETFLTVSHAKSENKLKIYIRVGSEYVSPDNPIVYISASTDVVTLKKDSTQYKLTAALVNSGDEVENGFSFSIDTASVAAITAQYGNGTCFIKPVSAGQAEITVHNPKAEIDKKVLVIVGNTDAELAAVKYLTTTQNVITVGEGLTRNISVSVKNNDSVILDGFSWSSEDPSIAAVNASASSTAVVTGNKTGTTRIKVTNTECSYPLYIIVQCIDQSAAADNPYIQTNTSVLTLTTSASWTTVTAELVGGTDGDTQNFVWDTSDSSVIQAYGQNGTGKVRALKAGTAYLTVSHPKSPYPSQILCICDDAAESNCSISVSENIITMKPTDSAKTITASLVHGSETDRYNFKWSLDVYDVVDLDYSANTALIKPLQQGEATLTISHPKSAYDQQIKIKVSEYTQFAFASTNKTITKGTSTFVSMQVPATSVKTHVEYTAENPKILSVTGTSAVCQMTGLAAGTTTVKAKLVATATNTVQAEAEMLVAVEESTKDLVYITAANTVYTLEKGTNRTLTATLTGTGVVATDQYNLKWKSADPSIVSIKGVSTTGVASGQNVYVEAVAPGETTITISHEKSNSDLVFYVIVPGSEEKTVTLNKTYVTLEKGDSVDLKATISGGTTTDYNELKWTVDKPDGNEVARILGSGKTVEVYALSAGQVQVKTQLPNGNYAVCDILVENPKSLNFDSQTVRIQPGQEKTVGYTVSPSAAGLQWVQSEDTYVTYADKGNNSGKGTVTITGIKEGSSTLTAVTSYGNKATLQIVCAWDYAFTIDKLKLQGTPDQKYTIKFTVNPVNALITADNSNIAGITIINNGNGTGTIEVIPTAEGTDTVNIYAKNNSILPPADFASKSVSLDFKYSSLNVIPKLLSRNGSFSRYDSGNGTVVIGDGESMTLGTECTQQAASYEYTGMSFTATGNQEVTLTGSTSGNKEMILSGGSDSITNMYKVTEDTDIYFQGRKISPEGWEYVEGNGLKCYRSTNYIDMPVSYTVNYHFSATAGDDSDKNRTESHTETLKMRLYRINSYNNRNDGSRLGVVMGLLSFADYSNWMGGGSESYTLNKDSITCDDILLIKNRYYVVYYLTDNDLQQRTVGETVYFSQTEFESKARFYIPAHNYYYSGAEWRSGGRNKTVDSSLNKYQLCRTAQKIATTSTALESSLYAGYLTITYSHAGKSTNVKIPVYREVRGCKYNQ